MKRKIENLVKGLNRVRLIEMKLPQNAVLQLDNFRGNKTWYLTYPDGFSETIDQEFANTLIQLFKDEHRKVRFKQYDPCNDEIQSRVEETERMANCKDKTHC